MLKAKKLSGFKEVQDTNPQLKERNYRCKYILYKKSTLSVYEKLTKINAKIVEVTELTEHSFKCHTDIHMILEICYQHNEYAETIMLILQYTLLSHVLCVCPLPHCTTLFNSML